MSSILLNPQLIIYSTALGGKILAVRIVSCFVCGVVAGAIVRLLYVKKEKPRGCSCAEGTELNNFPSANRSEADVFDFTNAKSLNFKEMPLFATKFLAGGSNPCGTFFDFHNFDEPRNKDVATNPFFRYIKVENCAWSETLCDVHCVCDFVFACD